MAWCVFVAWCGLSCLLHGLEGVCCGLNSTRPHSSVTGGMTSAWRPPPGRPTCMPHTVTHAPFTRLVSETGIHPVSAIELAEWVGTYMLSNSCAGVTQFPLYAGGPSFPSVPADLLFPLLFRWSSDQFPISHGWGSKVFLHPGVQSDTGFLGGTLSLLSPLPWFCSHPYSHSLVRQLVLNFAFSVFPLYLRRVH